MAQIAETELDVRALNRALWRRSWLLVAMAIAVAVATYLVLGSMDPVYTADTSLLIEERESPITRPNPDENAAQLDESAIQSHVEVLRSRQIANTVIDRLDLIRRPEFDPATRPSTLGSLLILLGLKDHPAEDTIRQRIMDTYYDRLTVFPIAKSRVISIQFEAPDPELAAEVANAVARAFVDLQQEAKRESAVAATQWLQQEIERLRGRVAQAERAVADYRARNELFTVGQDAGTLSTQQLSEINAELTRARAARAEAEARAGMIGAILQDGGALDSSEEVLDSPLIQRLRERQVALRAEIADLSTTLLPGHPRVRSLQSQLNNLDGQIRQEVGKVQASLNTAARVAAARERSLLGSLNEAKVAVGRTNGQEIELRALERESAAQRDLLESFLGRYREALARTDADYLPADARIISRAVAPGDPSFPKKSMMSVAAGLAAFLIGAAITVMGEFTSGRAFRIVGAGTPLGPVPEMTVAPPASVIATLRPGIVDPVAPAAAVVAPAAVVAAMPEPAPAGHLPPAATAEVAMREEPVPATLAEASEAPLASAVAPLVATRDVVDDMAGPDRPFEDPAVLSADPAQFEGLRDLAPLAIAAGLFDPAEEPELPFYIASAAPAPTASDADPGVDLDPHAAAAPAEATIASGPETSEPQTAATALGGGLAAVASLGPAEPFSDRPGMAELAELLASPAVRVALFAGAQGGEGAGAMALSVATKAASEDNRFVVLDLGRDRSDALGGPGEPGLAELLAGEYAFGDVIRRDENSRVHVIPMGNAAAQPPLQRLQLVVGALTHTYDKVVVVANSVEDWPHEHVKPDVAAVVFGAQTAEPVGAAAYEAVLERGARTAVVIPFEPGVNGSGQQSASAAA